MKTTHKHSKKREAILEALRATTDHPSAEWIYTRLKPQYPNLSLGTVYRNLALFLKEGDIILVGNFNGQDRYDACTTPHLHFCCDHCGRVLDLNIPDDSEKLYHAIAQKHHCKVSYHNLVFHGLCEHCNP
ncbi:MAG: Fur family transcriptional regulator [Oscillospiraceae bacterium]|jgi:Fur family peroxide stress response transcriptional regulator